MEKNIIKQLQSIIKLEKIRLKKYMSLTNEVPIDIRNNKICDIWINISEAKKQITEIRNKKILSILRNRK
jgi:hypothetical protein